MRQANKMKKFQAIATATLATLALNRPATAEEIQGNWAVQSHELIHGREVLWAARVQLKADGTFHIDAYDTLYHQFHVYDEPAGYCKMVLGNWITCKDGLLLRRSPVGFLDFYQVHP